VNATQPTASFRDYSEMANYLQKQCINVDECLNLFAAVKSGDKNFVQFLLIAADMKAVNSKGWTPLHIASYSGKRDIVEVMAQHGANLSIETANRIGDPLFISRQRRATSI
jgi:ankyrin repeat protein